MISAIRYPGGKGRKDIRQRILSQAPGSFAEFREPFCGSLGIALAIDISVPRWINDLDSGLISVFRALRDYPDDFIGACDEIADMISAETHGLDKTRMQKALIKELFEHMRFNDQIDQSVRWFYLNRMTWNGRVRFDRLCCTNHRGWQVVEGSTIWNMADWLKNARITSGDYLPLLQEPGHDVLIYADPPYVCNTELSKSNRLYEHSFELEDHIRLAEQLMECRHRVLLSYDDHPLIHRLYEGWNIHRTEWTYVGMGDGRKGQELVITNYTPPGKEF